ncbi:MAG: OadG family protein [Chloroflexi bacterium]|nr:OadG family protein [Chloroflexota bacterium]
MPLARHRVPPEGTPGEGYLATSDSETLVDGLIVTGIGMGVVFLVLIALAITSRIMSWLDASETVRNVARKFSRSKGGASDQEGISEKAATPAPQGKSGPSGEEVAAITVALAMARRSTSLLLPAGPATVAGSSTWADAGRRRAMERASRISR